MEMECCGSNPWATKKKQNMTDIGRITNDEKNGRKIRPLYFLGQPAMSEDGEQAETRDSGRNVEKGNSILVARN